MPSFKALFLGLAVPLAIQAQGVILSAKGDSGVSKGLQVDPNDPTDANFISLAEVTANVVNECGRTLQGGNIDIGENVENALVANEVTSVKKGSDVLVTIRQDNANGTGPFTCDMDQTENSLGAGQTPLTVKEGAAGSGTGNLTLTVTMPADMACIGASTGNICAVRCRNAQNFGGCFPVQQTDTVASKNSPEQIATTQTLDGINKQVAQNVKDLPAAVSAIEGASLEGQGKALAEEILAADPVVESAVVSSAAATATAGAKKGNGNANANAGGNGNGRATGGNGNGNGRGGRNGNKRAEAGLRWAKRDV
ncbi:hypothetical protein GLAREA_06056 [Glarea lozoyensis ATCC 20868]|nr:uncharacterized protein GLAREA_06056 [Glarea lozoyensis ATCC 20868]EPE33044.1 hypothetical protein GLAREA_06056 [Glarea lozoyensis ATCC 20868]